MVIKSRQVVLITSASRGIGNTCATFLAKRGHAVYGTSRSPGSMPRMMDEFFDLLSMDNLDEHSIQTVVSHILEKEGHIDTVICNAGTTILGAVENTPTLDGLQQLEVNFMGAARLIHAVLPIMRKNQSGTILIVSSIAGRIGLPFNAYYSASNFALVGFVESLRLELADSGVRVALIEPGSVCTSIEPRITCFTGEPEDPYTRNYLKVLQIITGCAKEGINPVVIARLVHRLMYRERLRSRYFVGLFHQRLALLLKYVLPTTLYESLLLMNFKIMKTSEE